jgi:CubicO group peptidase (beta-lactamase class C family)
VRLPALVLIAALLSGSPARAADCAATASTVAWPADVWRAAPPDVARPEVQALDAYLFPSGLDEAAREGVRTNGLVVVRDGIILHERYARGFGPETPHIAWSVTKSVLHALYGAAVRDGLVDIGRPVAERSPWIGTGDKARITYRDLLAMSSGLGFQESYEYAPIRSSVIAMLYTRGRGDMGLFAAGHELDAPPGTLWSYKSGDSLVLARALRDVVGPESYPDYPWTALFDRLGLRSAVWERDGKGILVGSSYLYATPRDLARIGLLYFAEGCWAGERVLPEGWVTYAGTLAPALEDGAGTSWWRRAQDRGPESYGAHWWLNRAAGGRPPYPDVPEDALVASGHWGQKLVVIPSRRLVVVRTGDDRDGSFGTNRFLRLVLAAFEQP